MKIYFPVAAGTPAAATPVPDADPRGNGEVVPYDRQELAQAGHEAPRLPAHGQR